MFTLLSCGSHRNSDILFFTMRSLLLAIVFSACALAQFETATVLGTVRDTSGAVIPDALVTLTNTRTGIVSNTKTNADGDYEFFNVRIGEYTVKASAAGFSNAAANPFTVVVNARQRVDLTMQVS